MRCPSTGVVGERRTGGERQSVRAGIQSRLAARDTARRPEGRLREKIRLVKSLHRRGIRGDDIREILRLIDWLLGLPLAFALRLPPEVSSVDTPTR